MIKDAFIMWEMTSLKTKIMFIGVVVIILAIMGGVIFYQNQKEEKAREEMIFFEQQQQQEIQQNESEELIKRGQSEEIINRGNAIATQDNSITKNTVEIKGFAFHPKILTIKSGTRVVFINKDSVEHSATSNDGMFDTGSLKQGEVDSVLFEKTGTYTYHCVPHPNMQAIIVVE